MAADQRGDRDLREFSRISVLIPVRVEIVPLSTGAASDGPPGTLLNIGRGGGRVRVRWEFPPRTRLFISLPIGSTCLRLLAEVVWVSRPAERGLEPAVYGLRWVQPLSSGILGSVLLRQGSTGKREVPHVPEA